MTYARYDNVYVPTWLAFYLRHSHTHVHTKICDLNTYMEN